MSKLDSPLKVTMGLEFDTSEAYGDFCKMLIAGGYEHVVKGMAQEMLNEARRRNLPIAAEIEAALERTK